MAAKKAKKFSMIDDDDFSLFTFMHETKGPYGVYGIRSHSVQLSKSLKSTIFQSQQIRTFF